MEVQLVGLLSGSIVGPRCHQCSKVYGTPGAPVTSTRLSIITGLDYWNGLLEWTHELVTRGLVAAHTQVSRCAYPTCTSQS